ncbi:50S ribosomal protein L5 [Candidatus Bathyarchaeota archaeon]|nr:50S ribosomal protein L5 [Candidatus Bathyarchaeota archaeon]
MTENPMKELRIGKVVVNISVGASGEPLDNAMTILQQITGQQPCQRAAKQTVRQFNLRKKEPMACLVTLRGEKANTFLEKAFKAVDSTINPKSFDKQGNFAFGIKEHIDIPGTKYDPRLGITGMDVMATVERPGYRVSRRKRAQAKVGSSHRVTPDESMSFISETFAVKVGTDQ